MQFNGFDLDIGSIGMRSIDDKNIMLPYTGTLPPEICVEYPSVSSACISADFSPIEGAKVSLVIFGKKIGAHNRRAFRLVASDQEITDLMYLFFYGIPIGYKGGGIFKTNFKTGLTDYWLGYYQSMFNEWNKLAKSGWRVVEILRRLSEKDLKTVQHYMTQGDGD